MKVECNVVDLKDVSQPLEASVTVHRIPFTMVNRELIQKSGLSVSARMLIIYLISFDKGWTFYDELIQKDLMVGRDKLVRMYKELTDAGYMKRVFIRVEGRMCGSKRVFSSQPEFKISRTTENPYVGEFPELRGFQGPGNPVTRKPAAKYNNSNKINRSLNKTTTTDASTIEESVVVSLGEKQMELVEQLKSNGISTKDAIDWVRIYGDARIIEVLEYVKAKEMTSPGGYIRDCIVKEWKISKQKSGKSAPVEYLNESETKIWAKEMWSKLDDKKKVEEFTRIRKKDNYFANMTKDFPYCEISLNSFIESPIFSAMVVYAGYKPKRLESKPIENS